jgi:hypothetical protein
MTDQVECQITILMDEDGDWVVCKNDNECVTDAAGELADEDSVSARRVNLSVFITPPAVTDGKVIVPDAADGELAVAFTREGKIDVDQTD